MTELKTVPVDAIVTRPGFNPRREIDVDGLVKSISEHGIRQPLEVRPHGDKYLLVAGERRYTAALLAKFEDVPVPVKHDLGEGENETPDELVAAIIENTQREDLNPVEVAEAIKRLRELGYTSRRQLAAKLSISEDRVKRFEQISHLPANVREDVAAGRFTLNAIEEMARIAEFSPALAEKLWTWAKERDFTARELIEDLYSAFWSVELGTDSGLYRSNTGFDAAVLPLSEKAKDLVERYNEALVTRFAIRLSNEALEAAHASGYFLPISDEDQDRHTGWLNSIEWIADRISQHLESKEVADDLEARIADPLKGGVPAATPGADDDDLDQQADSWEERNSAERKQAYKERVAESQKATLYNEELAGQLFERIGETSLTPKLADALIALALGDDGVEWALRGLRYLHPAWEVEDQTPTGKPKKGIVDNKDDAHERLASFLEASTAEQKLSRLLQLMAAAWFADERQVARTNRRGYQPHTKRYAPEHGAQALADVRGQLLRKLTPRLRKQVEEQTSEAGTEAAAEAAEDLGESVYDED